jgi:hypothetical protein
MGLEYMPNEYPFICVLGSMVEETLKGTRDIFELRLNPVGVSRGSLTFQPSQGGLRISKSDRGLDR